MKAFIIVPMMATTLSMNAFTASINEGLLQKGQSVIQQSPEEIALQHDRETNAAKIDAYYAKYDLPLAGYGMQMVLAGEKYGVDPFLLAGLAMRESTGCKFIIPRTNNCFGWGGGKIKFESFTQAIDTVAMNLGGHNEKTARHYAEKSTKAILEAYNPPSVVPTYASEVMGIMKKIQAMPA